MHEPSTRVGGRTRDLGAVGTPTQNQLTLYIRANRSHTISTKACSMAEITGVSHSVSLKELELRMNDNMYVYWCPDL